jgi:hypothetical protein
VDVHRRIELHHKGIVPLDDLAPELFDVTIGETSASESSDAFSVFASSRFAAEQPLLIEAPFELQLSDRVAVRGRVDAVYGHERSWEVVDFKSGRKSLEASRHVQLKAYAVAADRGAFGPERPDDMSVTFAYLGGELFEETEKADRSWLEIAEKELEALAEGITDGRFEPTPSASCHKCDFLRFCGEGSRFVG